MYRIGANGVVSNEDMSIPPDPNNADYQVYLAWLDAGNVAASVEIGPTVSEAQSGAKIRLSAAVNRFIDNKPDGAVRYDTNLKLNLLQAALRAVAAGQPPPPPVVAAQAWLEAIQAEYFRLKALIYAAATVDEVEALDFSLGMLEERFGVEGSEHPDPDISTSDLVAAG